jgi:hypothetical protein
MAEPVLPVKTGFAGNEGEVGALPLKNCTSEIIVEGNSVTRCAAQRRHRWRSRIELNPPHIELRNGGSIGRIATLC